MGQKRPGETEKPQGWWKDANEAEDPDRLIKQVKQVGRGAKQLGKAVKGEIKRDRKSR